MFFSNTHWPQLMAPFYSILFANSFCQFNSDESVLQCLMSLDKIERDQRQFLHPESLQTLQIPSSMLIFYLLQFFIGFRSGNWEQWQNLHFVLSDPFLCWLFYWKIQPLPHYKAFWPQDSNYFLQLSSCDPWRVFDHSNYLPHVALRQYRHKQYTVGRFVIGTT